MTAIYFSKVTHQFFVRCHHLSGSEACLGPMLLSVVHWQLATFRHLLRGAARSPGHDPGVGKFCPESTG